MAKDPELRAIYPQLQDEFDHLDKKLGPFNKRNMLITRMPELERDLYLVFELVGGACNSGIAAWIAHHDEEPGWNKCTMEALVRMGYPQVAADVERLLPLCRAKVQSKSEFTWRDDEAEANYVIDHEEEMIRALHAYLVQRCYLFSTHAG